MNLLTILHHYNRTINQTIKKHKKRVKNKNKGVNTNLELEEKRSLKVRNAGDGTHWVGDIEGPTPRN